MRSLLLSSVLLFAFGCAEEQRVFSLELILAPSTCADPPVPLSASDLPGGVVRLSAIRRAGSTGAGELLCNALGDYRPGSSGSLDLDLTLSSSETVDLLVEVFDQGDPPQLVAQGTAFAANTSAPEGPLSIFLARRDPAQERRCCCAGSGMAQGRAFHSATVLPNGEVLVLGGVTSGSGAQMVFAEQVEVYSPRTGAFRVVGRLPGGRAFHTANLLAADSPEGPFDLLLVGGLTAREESGLPALLIGGAAAGPLPIVPGTGAQSAPSLVVRYYPWGDTIDGFGDSPQLARRFFHAAAVLPDGRTVLFGGARDHKDNKLTSVADFEILDRPGDTSHQGPFELIRPRYGAMAAALSPDRVLVFGGNLDSEGGKIASEAFEIVSFDTDGARATAATLQPGTTPPPSLAFGTLIAAGRAGQDPHLLLAGGLLIAETDPGRAMQVNTEGGLYRIAAVEGEEISVSPIEPPGSFAPVAYHAGAGVEQTGEVILSGGWPATCAGTGPLCGSAELYRYDRGALTLEARMIAPRVGHAMALMPGNIVLVSGGLDQLDNELRPVSSAELHPLSDGGHRLDPWARNPARLDPARTCGGGS